MWKFIVLFFSLCGGSAGSVNGYQFSDLDEEEKRPTRSSFNLFSRLTSWFSLSLLPKIKEKGKLEEQDLPGLEHEDKTSYLHGLYKEKFESAKKSDGRLSLYSLLHRTVGPKYYFSGLWVLLAGFGRLGKSVLLTYLLFALEDGSEFNTYFTMFCGLVLLNFIQNMVFRRTTYQSRVNYNRISALLSAAFYEKTLTLSPFSRKEYTKGTMFNLLSNDLKKIGELSWHIHNLWVTPVILPLALLFMVHLISWPAVVGFVVTLALAGTTNYLVMRKQQANWLKIDELKDERSEKLTEIFQGIRVVKMFTWEKKFQENVNGVIETENGVHKKQAYLNAIIELSWVMVPVLITIISILIHVSLGNELTAAVAFGIYSTATQLSWFFFMFPNAMSGIMSAKISVKRLETFFNLREQSHERYSRRQEPVFAGDPVVEIKKGSFSWTDEKSSLHDINLTIGKGQLVAIVGEVGSGKSSLLSAITGEIECVDGSTIISSKLAYVPQQSFILNATLRDNVLFMKPFDKDLYNEALRVSCLDRDVSILPSGDMTLIGEKGINLSGGQKARVNLARAVYNQSSLVLLDDPLSAVDAHVGAKIFHECILDTLKNKTRVLVTHQIHFIKPEYNFDIIIVMRDGKIAESGTFAELYKPGKEFYSLFRHSQSAIGKKSKSDASSNSNGSAHVEHMDEQVNEEKPEQTEDMPEEEEKQKRLSWNVFMSYFLYLRSIPFFVILVLAYLFSQFSENAVGWWLSYWTDNAGTEGSMSIRAFMGIFFAVGMTRGIGEVTKNIVNNFACLRIATNAFDLMLERVLHAKPAFFDVTPIGRIIKRFQHDHSVLVDDLQFFLREAWQMIFFVLGDMIMTTVLFPISFVVWVPFVYGVTVVYKYYASIVLEVWDLESRCKSPIYSNYGETVDGLGVIRAYGFADAFLRKNMFLNDRMSNTGIAGRDLQMWYSFCLTTLGTIAFFVVGTMLLLNPLPQGQMGYVLSLILGLSVGFDWMFECLSNVELAMGAFGRLNHYISEVPQEQYAVDPFSRVSDDLRLKSSELGNSIVIKKLQLQYNPEDRPVLNDVSLTINKAEKIGICGRTGAGKSSIINALLRMAPITQGEVFVNDLPASQMELTKLRSQIAIIPQDPVLFSGTIRSNLDPFNDYEDHQLWMALDKVCLKDVITALPNQLDAEISENGSNFSVGQRQLICLARAVLRKIRNSSLILLMDEATANVDPKTDSLIQQTIQEEFESCTVLTIAHRINTIMHCNRILVMEKGHVAEYDSPQVLLANPQSHFAQLVRQSTANLLATSAE